MLNYASVLSENKQEPMQPVMDTHSPALNHVPHRLEQEQLQHVVPRITMINNKWSTSDQPVKLVYKLCDTSCQKRRKGHVAATKKQKQRNYES